MKPLLSTALATLLCLPLAAHAETAAPQKMTLMLDWFVNPDHGPIIVAAKEGFFAAQGIDLEIVAPADPADPPKLVAAGKADIAVSYQPQLHLQVHEGLPLVRVGTLIATPLNCLMVDAKGPVQSLADLKGKKVGYSVSGVESAVVQAMLGSAGLKPDDVAMINVNWSLTPALMTGQVDAVIGAYRNFEITQMAIAGGEGRCFPVEEHGVPTYDELIFEANPQTMDRALIGRFLAAVEEGAQFIANHPEKAWEDFSSYAPDLKDELNQKAWADTVARFSQSPAGLDAGRYARFENFLHEAGLVDSVLPVSALAIDLGAETAAAEPAK